MTWTLPSPRWPKRISRAVGARRAKPARVSVCTHQYAAIVDFLQSLGFVDPNRIGYQGLSYGGFTGLWVVSQEPRISPVVVAGYFSDWKARLFDDAKACCFVVVRDPGTASGLRDLTGLRWILDEDRRVSGLHFYPSHP